MTYLLLFQNSANEYSLAYENAFFGADNKEDALKLIPDNYNGYHAADKTWSTSAALDWITCRQHIVEFNDFAEVDSFLEKPYRGTNFGGWGSSRPGIAIDKEKYEELKKRIIKSTALITPEVNSTKPFYETI